jgi:hypothetical protein
MFVLTVAAGEAAIGLAILVIYFRRRGTIAVDDVNRMKGWCLRLNCSRSSSSYSCRCWAPRSSLASAIGAGQCARQDRDDRCAVHSPARSPGRSSFLMSLGPCRTERGAGAALGPVGQLSISHWALRVDALTAVMLVVVTSVSALVHLYSWGYMDEDPDQPRFFAYLSLFTFAMLMLVTATTWCRCSSAGKAWASPPIC